MEWSHLNGITALCNALGVDERDYRRAIAERSRVYIQRPNRNLKTGKIRQLCYPHPNSTLCKIQVLVKDRILDQIELLSEVRGYRKKSHNINAAADVCGMRYMGKVDISRFHPSITPRHLATALREHGLSPSWSREIARIATYNGGVPQGAATSNHAANVVVDSLLRRFIKPLADRFDIIIRNYGDDIGFWGDDDELVKECVDAAKTAIASLGFRCNEKCRSCEHRGERREFIGCATGRDAPDYPRSKYRELRRELRTMIHAERSRDTRRPLCTWSQLNSLRQRIAYVKRLNRHKARALLDLYYRLCKARRGPMRIADSA